mgnify:FL=1
MIVMSSCRFRRSHCGIFFNSERVRVFECAAFSRAASSSILLSSLCFFVRSALFAMSVTSCLESSSQSPKDEIWDTVAAEHY